MDFSANLGMAIQALLVGSAACECQGLLLV